MSITILLADDHHIVRQGLKALLKSEADFEIIAEASEGSEAVQKIHQLRPIVSVVDVMMPGISGLEVLRQAAHLTHIIILSMHANEAYVVDALQNGAYGYVLKDSTSADLVQAIHAAAQGKRFLSEPLTERAIQVYTEKASTALDPFETLTAREKEVLLLSARGLNTPEISRQLSISPRTVEVYRANLMRKLNLRNQSDLIRYTIRKGLLPLED